MGLEQLAYLEGQTPLDEDEKEGLLIPTIATRQELDELEQQNIEQAILWTLKRTFKSQVIFSEEFTRKLHKRMYANVWRWAGTFRKTNKNLGVDKWQIVTDLHALWMTQSIGSKTIVFLLTKLPFVLSIDWFQFIAFPTETVDTA